jgi:hypothetical protein
MKKTTVEIIAWLLLIGMILTLAYLIYLTEVN